MRFNVPMQRAIRIRADKLGIQEVKGISVWNAPIKDVQRAIHVAEEFNKTFESAEGKKNPRKHPIYGWPIAD